MNSIPLILKPSVLFAICFLRLLPLPTAAQERPVSKEPTGADIRLQSWQLHQQMKASSPYRDLQWNLVGPRMCGGRIESIACPPGNNSTIYAGVGSGGVWKTVNHGTTWKPIFDDQPTQAIGDICVSKSNPDIVWVGTGEVLMARSSLAGLGVFKSEDAGKTWRHMGLEDTHHIGRVLIDPNDPDIVFVAAIGHRYSGNENRGIFKTSDGGQTWKKVLYKGIDVSAIDIVFDPNDSNTIYATTWQRDLKGQDHYGKESGIYRSSDGGESWKRLTKGLPTADQRCGRIAIDIAPSNPQVIYALFDNAIYKSDQPRDLLFRSQDAGESWQLVNEKSLKTGWDWCEIRISPDNEDQVYSIGQKSFLSNDGGKSFQEIGGKVVHLLPHDSTILHLDTHSMWIDPANPDKVIFGNDGGLYLSLDRCQTWLHLNNLPIAECYALSYDNAEPFNVYIGTQDNAALFGPHTHRPQDGLPDAWKHVYIDRWGGGDSYFTYRDPSDPNTVYYEHQYGFLRRKNMSTGKTVSIMPKLPGNKPMKNAWMTPFFPSHFDGKTIYYASDHVFKSTNRGDGWQVISPNLAAGPNTVNLRYKAITTMTESTLKQGLLFAGTDNGNLFKTMDDGKNWTPIDEQLPRCNFRRVFSSPHDASKLFVALSGLQTDDFSAYLYRSDDQGKTWRSISTGLPSARINVVLEDPLREEVLYIGNDLGVYVSKDGGRNWQSLSNGLPAVSVHDLFVHPKTKELIIGTHGRSVFSLDVSKL